MSNITEYEYSVDLKSEGKNRILRILLIVFYVIYILVGFLACYITKLYQLFAVVVILFPPIIYSTWRLVSYTKKYYTESGKIIFYNVYGRKEKKVLEKRIKDFEEIAPLNDSIVMNIKREKSYIIIDMLSSPKSPDRYYAMCYDENGNKTYVFFEATSKSLKILSYYNEKTIISETQF